MKGIEKTAETLNEKESFQKRLLDAMPIGVVVVNADTGIIESSNYAANKMLGTNIIENTGGKCRSVLCADLKASCTILDCELEPNSSEFIVENPDGSKRSLTRTVKKVLWKDNLKLVEFFMDNTEWEEDKETILRKNRELENINAKKDKYFSVLAHDLRSPFQSLIGLTQMMSDNINDFTQEQLTAISCGMNSTAKNVYKLLENLLDWVKIQKGFINYSPDNYNLCDIIKQSIEITKVIARQKEIMLINTISQDISVYADDKMVCSIVQNLLSNAVKFTAKGGTVVIRAQETKEKMIMVSIEDNGVGMHEDLQLKLFKLEEKVGSPGTDGEQSSGLGLLLCKDFVELSGGKIWTESREGKGSTFYFTLEKSKGVES